MKVVLLKDIRGTGRAGAAITVADGHALNFLIPRGMAALATPTNLKQAEQKTAQLADERALASKLIAERMAALAQERIVFTKKANELGHLYDGLDAKEIAEKTQLPVDAISLEKPIKEIGEFEIPVSQGENFGKISIVIEAE
jgi:large subunit ribosomal protein L9